MLVLSTEHVREFLEEDPSEEADTVRLLLTRMEQTKGDRQPDDIPTGASPLDRGPGSGCTAIPSLDKGARHARNLLDDRTTRTRLGRAGPPTA